MCEQSVEIPRGLSFLTKEESGPCKSSRGEGSRYRESALRKPPSQLETARYLGMFYTSLGNNVLLPR